MGRFIQPDPKEFDAGDYNLYRYCHNDPVNKNDATGEDWLEFTGQSITWYPGNLGDRNNPSFSVPAVSGTFGHQGSGNTNEKGIGAIPKGDYNINTGLNPNRQAEVLPTGELASGKGIQKAGTADSDWGTERARLEKADNNSTDRDNLYLHNSNKGYSHGCVEAPSKKLWEKLHNYHDAGNKKLSVRVDYKEKPVPKEK